MNTSAAFAKRLAARNAAETRFRLYGLLAIGTSLLFLLGFFASLISQGYSALRQTVIALDVSYDAQVLGLAVDHSFAALQHANYPALLKATLREQFPEARSRSQRRQLYALISSDARYQLQQRLLQDATLIGSTERLWVRADDDVDMLLKGYLSAASDRLSERQRGWIAQLQQSGRIQLRFNHRFFSAGDSREAELAGVFGALVGSLLTLGVALALAFPIGVATAIYLEELAPTNRWIDAIDLNINNLAAVPSIVFGVLGLALLIDFAGMPRSVPLVGGIVLALMSLPTIIIASRAALKSIPPWIRDASLALGASRIQCLLHHVLPLALPGIMTGTIISMARALGESAPLLMIGMVAFIVDIPRGLMDPSTVLPVQIFLWADNPERAFVERTAAAIIVLLLLLVALNAVAVILRRKTERQW